MVTWDVVPKTYNPIDFESLETLFRDANTHFSSFFEEGIDFFLLYFHGECRCLACLYPVNTVDDVSIYLV